MYFKKVSLPEWKNSQVIDELKNSVIEQWYEDLKLPTRATKYSAGYDFFMPYSVQMPPESTIVIPTGIRWVTEPEDMNHVLLLMPRSGLGFKYGLRLSNTIGVIDADYYNSDNEGHIMLKLHNPSSQIVTLGKGTGFVQGIITKYTTVDGDKVTTERNGGMGSTNR